jgi:molybdate transport system ATP-binding protein
LSIAGDARGAPLRVDIRKTLRDFELRVDRAFDAGVTLVIGPSGAGKTMLLRILAGLVRPDAGTVAVGSRILDAPPNIFVPPTERGVGLVFQDYALFPHLSVNANVAYGLGPRRIPPAERERHVREMLERLDIGSLGRERPAALSGGQRQRVALARALVTQPGVLLLDEPLAALDPLTRSRVRAELGRLLSGLAIPTILVTHDPVDAQAFPDRVIALEAGTIVLDTPYAALAGSERTEFLKMFAGVESPGSAAHLRV